MIGTINARNSRENYQIHLVNNEIHINKNLNNQKTQNEVQIDILYGFGYVNGPNCL